MNFSDLINFLIAILVMTYLYFKRKNAAPKEEGVEEGTESDREKALRDFLHSLEGDMIEGEEQPPPKPVHRAPPPAPLKQEVRQEVKKPHRTLHDAYSLKTKLETFQPKTAVEERQLNLKVTQEQFDAFGNQLFDVNEELVNRTEDSYKLVQEKTQTRLQKIVQGLPSKREMIVLQEIMGPPKALR